MDHDASSGFEEPPDIKPVAPLLPSVTDTVRDEEFNFSDGNLFLTVENVTFVVHKSRLSGFRKLEPMLQSHTEIELEGRAVHFRNTFKVLWPNSESDLAVWASAIIVANEYDYPALRTFAIGNLARAGSPIMDCIYFARLFDIPEWEARAVDYLVSRDEPITIAEAESLGMEPFVNAVVRREQRLTVQRSDPTPAGLTNELCGSSGNISRASVPATYPALETNAFPRDLPPFPHARRGTKRGARSLKRAGASTSTRVALSLQKARRGDT